MYCNKCGNVLADGSLFCTFCGAKNASNEQPAAESTPIHAEPELTAPENYTAPVAAPMQTEQPPIQPIHEAPQAVFTTEQEIPRMAPNFGGAVPIQKENKPKEKKYYTFGHIMLCLSAVALMAIVAGVFAGLYFSVR